MYVNVKTIFFNNDGLQIKKIKPVFNFIKGNKTKILCLKTANKIIKTCGKHVENDNYLFATPITNRIYNDFSKIL
jgi:hypothetical protein